MEMECMSENNIFYRAKSIISSLYGIILWSTTFPSSMQISKQYWTSSSGLKTLINPTQRHPFIIHSYSKKSSSSSSLRISPSLSIVFSATQSPANSSPNSSTLDDLIGTESGVCLNSSVGERAEEITEKQEASGQLHSNLGKRNQQPCYIRKKYPPTIPLLARTGNLPGHMPWILTRHYSDGRLILREERLKHHEYFESYRENGRLILKLVALDDSIRCYHDIELMKEERTQERLEEHEEEEEIQIYEELMHDPSLMASLASSVPKSPLEINECERHGDVGKCFTWTISDSYLSCNANAHRNGDGYVAPSGSELLFSRSQLVQ